MAEESAPRLSHSAVEDYSGCGEKYRLRRIAKVPQIPSWSLVGGSAFHTVTEHFDNLEMGYDDGGPSSFEEALLAEVDARIESSGILPEYWTASGRASAEWPDKENQAFWLKNGAAWFLQYQRFVVSSPWQTWVTPDGEPAVEIELNWFVGDVEVRGYVDRIWENAVTGALLVVDVKTGSREPGVKQLVTYHNGIAALFKAREWGRAPIYGGYYMARKAMLTSPENIEILDDGRLEYEYAAAARGITNEVFLPSKSMLCGYCNVKDYCREVGGDLAARELPYSLLA